MKCPSRSEGGKDEYDASADFARSIDECYRAIRERVLAGGPGWRGWPTDVRAVAGGQAGQRPDPGAPLAVEDRAAAIPAPMHRCTRNWCDAMNHELWQRWQRQADEADIKSGNSLDELSFQQVELSSEAWRIESPLEYRFYVWLKRLAAKYGYLIKAQWQLDRFRYDFTILDKSGDKLLALIECDSAEFHRLPEQLQRDAEKDVAARAASIRLFRWSGREIYRDAHRCAEATFFSIWPAGQ